MSAVETSGEVMPEQSTKTSETKEKRARAGSTQSEKMLVVAVLLVPVLYALVVNWNALDNPPAWDSAVTVSPAAITIVETDFDVWEVAQMPSSPEGGPSTHATSIYTIGLAVLIAIFGPATAFTVAHVSSVILVGGMSASTYLLARERASMAVSALAGVTASVLPLVMQQAADVYIDLPLAVIATLAVWTATRRWFWWTVALVFLAVAVKTSGLFLVPLILFAKPAGKPWARHLLQSAGAGVIAVLPFVPVFLTTHRFSTESSEAFFNPILLRSTVSLLFLTIDVFVILSIYSLVIYGRARSGALDRATKSSVIAVSSFFVVHIATMVISATIVILPRYYIAIMPAVLAALLPTEQQRHAEHKGRYWAAVAVVSGLALFSIVNVRGDFYPRPDDDFYVIAERSTRAQHYLELQMLGTQKLVSTELPLVVERQVFFQLEFPDMGYVEATTTDVIPIFLEPDAELPETFAMLIERRHANPLIAVEEEASAMGYDLHYEDVSYGPYRSQLVIASR
jgi:hypothetical protein